MTLAVERQDARAGDDPRRLARLRAGQARADRLAGREGDRARRGAADPGDDAADDRRAGEARTAGSDRDRGRRAMRPDAAAGDRRAGAARSSCSQQPRSGAATLFRRRRRRRAGRRRVRARPGADPDRPRRRLHRRGARRDPRRAERRRRSRSARASCAPKPRRSPRSPPTWRSPATGGLSTHKSELLARRLRTAKRRRHDARAPTTAPARSIESRDDLLSVFAGGEKPRERLAHRHRAREVRLSHAPTIARRR